MKENPTMLEMMDTLESHGFGDELGHPLVRHAYWALLREKLGSEQPELYTVEDGWAELFTGERFFYRDPTVEMIHFTDIAEALGKVCRYAGHVHTFYSVAEHCCLLMRYARDNLDLTKQELLTVLMHDATEAYLPDLPRPLKQMLPQFKAFEHTLEAIIAERFNLLSPHPTIIRELDSRIICDERLQALNPSENDWGVDRLTPLNVKLHLWTPAEAIDNFTGDFQELIHDVA